MAILKIQLHPSMRIDGLPITFEGDFANITIFEAIVEVLKEVPEVLDLCISNNKSRAGVLFFVGKTEITSLGLLDNQLDSDMHVRVVPILHGGT